MLGSKLFDIPSYDTNEEESVMTVRFTTSDFLKEKTCRMHHNQSCKNEIKKDIKKDIFRSSIPLL